MKISSISVPEVYKSESADFRFFMKWFELALSRIQYDTEEFFDLFDPIRCPASLLWMLGDTMGYKYDDRMLIAFNRLAMVYFMSMIRLKGSKDGVTLSAQVNLSQFKLQKYAENNAILNNRLEDISIPSNSVYVQPHVPEGYIDVVYFSDEIPVDSCIEYTRPIGMYLVPHSGVRYDIDTKISIDARLTDTRDLNISIGSTHVGHYSQSDYSRMQRLDTSDIENNNVRDAEGVRRINRPYTNPVPLSDTRDPVWYRNSKYEGQPSDKINPGYRALYSLQLSVGDTTFNSLFRYSENVSKLKSSDVSVFDTEGNVYTDDYYQNQINAVDNPSNITKLGDSMYKSN